MTHSYSRRTRSKSYDERTSLVAIILITGTLYAHRIGLYKAIFPIVWIIGLIGLLFAIKYTYKTSKRILKCRKTNNPSMKLIDRMAGIQFEHRVAGLLKNQGYTNVRLTEEYDYGVDIIANKDGITWGIQVKRYSGLVKADAVRQVVTALKKYDCDRAMVITNSIYSMVAKDLASRNNCVLIDRGIISKWIT
ncbi:MAG TPA: restriction endonuclease [Candidatus Dormibacteraeota bacterium]|nr:restriction endonuclease [Candidatus Dormibacteraeota bacterium]